MRSGGGAERESIGAAGGQGVGRGNSERPGGSAAGKRQGGSQGLGSTGMQRGVWVDPVTQHVGNIAQLGPGAHASGRW